MLSFRTSHAIRKYFNNENFPIYGTDSFYGFSPPPPPLSVTGEEYDDAVANLMAMGFEREQVVRALHASFNNPERAAEYLFSVSIVSYNADSDVIPYSG